MELLAARILTMCAGRLHDGTSWRLSYWKIWQKLVLKLIHFCCREFFGH